MIFKNLLILSLAFSISAFAEEKEPLWEYGIGLGFIRYEQYPASDQYSELFLPFPTFQYRGRVVRADDREGTRAFLFKDPHWTLEIAGGINPALSSQDNRARQGMEDLPWIGRLGPQAIYRFDDHFEVRAGVFQALSSDFKNTKLAGGTIEGQIRYRWNLNFSSSLGPESWKSYGFFSYSLKSGNREFLATYFDVSAKYATPDRPAYEARSGMLSDEFGYFQSFSSGRTALYLGGTFSDYSISANRESPLHKSDRTITYFAGLTYVLGESVRESVAEEETRGLINRHQKAF